MGKIRVATLGTEDDEKAQAAKLAKRREAKKQKKAREAAASGKSEEKATASLEKIAKEKQKNKVPLSLAEKNALKEDKAETKDKKRLPPQVRRKKVIGKNYTKAQKLADSKEHSLEDALKLVKKMSYVSFDETIELHANLRDKGLKGEVALPHGTGKDINVAIADDKVIAAIEAGNIDFDILIASPDMMPKLVKHARVLGPKGLMPNPKKGTVTPNPKEAAKKFKAGNLYFKSEAKAPLMHQAVGKKSFTDKQLIENIKALFKAVGSGKATDVYLSGSMTPSVKVDIESL